MTPKGHFEIKWPLGIDEIECEIKIYFALLCLGSEPGLESVEWPLGKKKTRTKTIYGAGGFFFQTGSLGFPLKR